MTKDIIAYRCRSASIEKKRKSKQYMHESSCLDERSKPKGCRPEDRIDKRCSKSKEKGHQLRSNKHRSFSSSSAGSM